MSIQVVDALFRRSAGMAARSVAADAKNSASKNKKAKKKCKRQVGQCKTFVVANCKGDPDCIAQSEPCCDSFGTCNAAGFITCIQDVPVP